MRLIRIFLVLVVVAAAASWVRAGEPVITGYRQVCDGQSCHLEPVYAIPTTIDAEQFVKVPKKDAGCKCGPSCPCGVVQSRFPVAREVIERQPVRHVAERGVEIVRGVACRLLCRFRR